MMLFSQSFFAGVDALGAVLLHFLWQGTLLGLVYIILRPICGGMSARYRLGMAVMLALALCPLITLAYVWPIDGASAPTGFVPAILAGAINAVAENTTSSWHLREILPALVAIWILGVVIIASRSLWHWRRLAQLVRHAATPLPEWEAQLSQMCKRFGLLRPVRLLGSASVATPMLIGWIKPVILLPLSMLSGFSAHQIELIIAHELGHVRRWDYVANLFQVIVETVLFYHPVVHWISRDVRNARESCCDDLVLSLAQGNRVTYARTLADLEELRHMDLVAPALGASGGVLLARIRRIVGVEDRDPLPRNNAWPVVLVVAALVFFALRPQHSVPDLASALSRLPAQSLALISGNPRLVVSNIDMPVLSAPVSMPVSESDLLNTTATESSTGAEPVAIRLDQPKVDKMSIVAANTPIRDLTAKLALPVASLMQAEVPAAEVPVRLHVVPPVYPSRAMTSGVEGNVELEYSIGSDGSVSDIRVVRTQPEGVFDAAAQTALSQWRFERPNADISGTRYMQNFAFTLHGKTAAADSNTKCQQVLGSLICRRVDE
jgi:bla regulator protein blaR1